MNVYDLSHRAIGVQAQWEDWTEGYGEDWDYIEAPTCGACGDYARWNDDEYEWRCENDNCDHRGQEIEDGTEGPMMSYSYALPGGRFDMGDAEKIRDLPLCLVSKEDSDGTTWHLALTGGGMDLTWEIAKAYVRLGYLPPLAYCDLPRMAGRPSGADDLQVVEACMASCRAARDGAERLLDRLKGHHAAALEVPHG